MIRSVEIHRKVASQDWELIDEVESEQEARDYVQELRDDDSADSEEVGALVGVQPTKYRIIILTEESFYL